MDYKNQKDIEEQFKLACRGGFLDVLQNICNQLNEVELQRLIPMGLRLGGHILPVVQYMMTNSKLKPYLNIPSTGSFLLQTAARKNLEYIKFLFSLPEIKNRPELNYEEALYEAAIENKTDIVNYFLFSKELKRNCDVDYDNHKLIKLCIYYQRSKSVDYLSQFYSSQKLEPIYQELLNNQKISSENPCFKKFKKELEIKKEKEELKEDISIENKTTHGIYKL